MSTYFFSNASATTEIYTLSLHDALPILSGKSSLQVSHFFPLAKRMGHQKLSTLRSISPPRAYTRSEEHTSELQSQFHLVCRLLLEKKKDSTPEVANKQWNG